jgi:hypothetical protein
VLSGSAFMNLPTARAGIRTGDPISDTAGIGDLIEVPSRAWSNQVPLYSAPIVHVGSRNPDIELTISVPVATATLRALTERAHLQGRNVESLIADALQGAA